ncbi:Uncharacterized protein APZ42_020190 [Daphnia magna]|uniref:Lactosylceramide n=1 Tax=Daphnia magna TaxID=35525 RepID=A0A164Y2R8_9CRUS|nr:Uncharacterized protein APZ42_020190 [Daphnia magna]
MKTIQAMWKQKCASTLLVIFKIIFPCCLLFLLVWTLNDGRRQLVASPGRETNTLDPSDGQDSAVCTGDLLDQRHHRYEKETDGNYRFTSDQTGPCRLLRYTTDRTVPCLDLIRYQKQLAGDLSNRNNGSLHFLFMGDSRVRQQFYNFVAVSSIKYFLNYDQIRKPIQNSPSFHDEMEITSNILKLRLSYKWRPLIDDNVTDTIRRWATFDPIERPHLLFLSIVVHHMLGTNGADHRLYEENFKKFAPELGRLAKFSQVIWFNQYPVEELPEKIHDHNTYIHSEKINIGKMATTCTFLPFSSRNENSSIRIWDSSDPLAEEYIRSCAALKRDEIVHVDSRPYLFKDAAFADCNDFIHTGYSALSQATNLLYNDICNNVMDYH